MSNPNLSETENYDSVARQLGQRLANDYREKLIGEMIKSSLLKARCGDHAFRYLNNSESMMYGIKLCFDPKLSPSEIIVELANA
jgi:hypothetical protein